jgi:hypothetical protein
MSTARFGNMRVEVRGVEHQGGIIPLLLPSLRCNWNCVNEGRMDQLRLMMLLKHTSSVAFCNFPSRYYHTECDPIPSTPSPLSNVWLNFSSFGAIRGP